MIPFEELPLRMGTPKGNMGPSFRGKFSSFRETFSKDRICVFRNFDELHLSKFLSNWKMSNLSINKL